jgi:serine/threonine protein kinase
MDNTNHCLSCMGDMGAGKTCYYCGYQEGTTSESILHLPPGTILQGKYLLGRALGQGGFGITYLAWDKTLKIKLAIKEYLPQQLVTRIGGSHKVTVYKASLSEDFTYGLSRFLEEAQTLARFIEHPNVVSVRDYFEANSTAYLAMNYYEGITLQRYLISKGGKIPVKQALSIFMPVLDALKEVHTAGILHRDISPDNLLIDKNGRVILIDFGAARQAMGEKSKSLSVIMKAGYSPVEQYYSKGEQGPWTDIYAIASSFYSAVTGQIPPESMGRLLQDDLTLPSQMGVNIDCALEKTLLRALAVKVEDRYQSVEELQSELFAATTKGEAIEDCVGVKQKKPAGSNTAEAKSSEEEVKVKAQAGIRVEAEGVPEKKTGVAKQPERRVLQSEPLFTVSKKTVITAAAAILCGLLFFGATSLFGDGDEIVGSTSQGKEEPLLEGGLFDIPDEGVGLQEEEQVRVDLDDETLIDNNKEVAIDSENLEESKPSEEETKNIASGEYDNNVPKSQLVEPLIDQKCSGTIYNRSRETITFIVNDKPIATLQPKTEINAILPHGVARIRAYSSNSQKISLNTQKLIEDHGWTITITDGTDLYE